MQKKTWIIVANSTSARVFFMDKSLKLKELETFIHPGSRLRTSDLVSDKNGRTYESFGMQRHAVEAKTTPKLHEFMEFAKQLISYLEEGRSKGSFNCLYVAANPTFLGLLRQGMDKSISQLIEKEVDKDIVHLKEEEIRQYFLPY